MRYTIIHYFITCEKTWNIWKSFTLWWNHLGFVTLNINGIDIIENLIFGFNNTDDNMAVLNYLVLNIKEYIYKGKQQDTNELNFYNFYKLINGKLNLC